METKSRGISCSFRVRKIFIEVTTCRGRGHIVSAELQAEHLVTTAKVGSGYVKYGTVLFVLGLPTVPEWPGSSRN